MTIPSQDARTGPYNGDGSTTGFDYDFKVVDQAHLVVTLTSVGGVDTVQTITTDYTVSGVGAEGGGTVTMVTAPASGEKLTITRDVTKTQEVDLQNRGAFSPQVIENALDKLTQITQDVSERLGRTLTAGVTSTSNFTLPAAAADKFIGWNSGATALENKTISDASTLVTSAFIDTLLDDSDAAEARTTLGLGTIATQAANNVSITGGSIANIASLLASSYGHNGSLAPHENLVITNNSTNPAYQVDVDADVFVVTNSAGEQVRLISVNLTADITASGANGLDTGTEASSTWYHIWIIYNGSTTSALLSTATAFGSLTLPSGYTYAGYAGAIRNTSGSDFYELKQIDKIVAARSTEVLNAGAATTYTTVDISGAVPPTAKNVGTVLGVVNLSGTNGTLEVRSGGVNGQNLNRVLHAITAVGATAVGNYNYAAFPHITAGQLEYQVNTAAIDGYINIIGWEY